MERKKNKQIYSGCLVGVEGCKSMILHTQPAISTFSDVHFFTHSWPYGKEYDLNSRANE
jgi:hypothetical protein